jgi:hypothetical protein
VDGGLPYAVPDNMLTCSKGRVDNHQPPCHYRYYWDNTDAAVVCHQLGYPREGAEAHRGKFLAAHISQPLVFDYFQISTDQRCDSVTDCGCH